MAKVLKALLIFIGGLAVMMGGVYLLVDLTTPIYAALEPATAELVLFLMKPAIILWVGFCASVIAELVASEFRAVRHD